MTRENLVDTIAEAISIFEGFAKPDSLAARNKNPGNFRTYGSYPTVKGYVVFPSLAHGWGALRRQVEKNIDRGLTLNEFFGGKKGVYPGYAPAEDKNNPTRYAAFVCKFVNERLGEGLTADTVLRHVYEPN